MTPFATVEDYEARYGEVEDRDRVETLLGDATAFIAGYPGFKLLGPGDAGYDMQWANPVRVACAVVYRSQSAGDLAGFTDYSETGVGYSANVKLSNPSGDFYLTKQEERALRIGGGRVGMTDPYGLDAEVGDGTS